MSTRLVKNVFGWDYFSVYLSGAIDFDKYARGWRDDWTERLIKIGFKKHQIFNPCRKPLAGAQFDLDNEGEIMSKHRENKEWKELCGIMSQIVHVDLRLVDKSDIVLVNFPMAGRARYQKLTDKFESILSGSNLKKEDSIGLRSCYFELLEKISAHRIPTYGTVHEIVEARNQRKPVFVVWEGGKETCSGWIMWLVGHRNVFNSVDELITRLDNISKGRTSYNARDWLLLDLDKE